MRFWRGKGRILELDGTGNTALSTLFLYFLYDFSFFNENFIQTHFFVSRRVRKICEHRFLDAWRQRVLQWRKLGDFLDFNVFDLFYNIFLIVSDCMKVKNHCG